MDFGFFDINPFDFKGFGRVLTNGILLVRHSFFGGLQAVFLYKLGI